MKSMTTISAFVIAFAASVAYAAEATGRLEGTIVRRDATTNQLTVAHAEVPGIMGAMTMPYEVRGENVMSLPKDGAKITATLHSSNGAIWLTDVQAEQPMAAMPAQPAAPQPGQPMDMPMQPSMPGMPARFDATSNLLMRQASGTSMNPAAAPMHMSMSRHGDWNVMLHGLAFVNQVQQTGPRGDDKFFSTNWIMGMADRPLGGGRLMFRSMLSLEPATVGDEYPELFQTGEVNDGRPLVDAQHPHDFFMELAAEYARPLSGNTIGYIYAAPHGDPSLGPVAFPHRASASEIPQAALSHHVQDSTHIAGSVVTLGAQSGALGFSASAFHGREPDEHRWDFDTGKLDSWAARLTYDPSPDWTAQVSTGHLTHPEALEPGDVQRTTASIAYSKATTTGQWDTSVVFGHNDKSEGPSTSAWLAESVLNFGRSYLTGRAELVDKDELFHGPDASCGRSFPVSTGDTPRDRCPKANSAQARAEAGMLRPHQQPSGVFQIGGLTLGYSRDVLVTKSMSSALGANFTVYSVPDEIQPYYGSSPYSIYIFMRLRGGSTMSHAAH